MPPRLTPSQKEVLSLYRRGLRAIRGKPEPAQPHFNAYLRHAFQHPSQGGGARKRDFAAVDYLIRRGKKMIEEVFEEKGVKNIHVPEGAEEMSMRRRRG